jgi:hypothetical protein
MTAYREVAAIVGVPKSELSGRQVLPQWKEDRLHELDGCLLRIGFVVPRRREDDSNQSRNLD